MIFKVCEELKDLTGIGKLGDSLNVAASLTARKCCKIGPRRVRAIDFTKPNYTVASKFPIICGIDYFRYLSLTASLDMNLQTAYEYVFCDTAFR